MKDNQELVNYWWRRAKEQEEIVRRYLKGRTDAWPLVAMVVQGREYMPEPHE